MIDGILGVKEVSGEVQATVSSTAELLVQLWDKVIIFAARILSPCSCCLSRGC